MNENGITFYVLSPDQYTLFSDFCDANGYNVPNFTLYDGNYYLAASVTDTDFLMAEYDDEVNPGQLDYSTRFWTMSTVPSALWP